MADAEKVTRMIIVKAKPEEAFRVWANFENFPHFMKNIKEVRKINDKTSYWRMEGPAGTELEWHAETTHYDEPRRIGWNSKDDEEADVKTSGQVTFTDLPNNETQVTVTLAYKPQKGGWAGDVAANLFDNPEKRLEEDLKNFKNYIEGRHYGHHGTTATSGRE